MKYLRALLFFAVLGLSLAQKTAVSPGEVQFVNNDGTLCVGCQLSTCVAGMACGVVPANPQATFTSATGGAMNTNPVVSDSAGRMSVWMTPGQSYKLELYNSLNTLLWTQDNVPGGSLVGAATVTANFVYSGPTSGAPAAPTFRALVANDIAAIGITCTNNFLTAIATCTTDTLAGPQHANQGTTTTVLHGNAAGNPAWGSTTANDFGTTITARSGLSNATSAAAAPTFSTTDDRLAYQVAEIPSTVFVSADFTTTSVTLANITGLTFTVPANTALNIPFVCYFIYSQATANVAVAFGLQDVTVSPTNIAGQAVMQTNTTAFSGGTLTALTTTTATNIISATPGATATNFMATITGYIQAPSNAASSAVNFMASTANAGDALTIRQGSYCHLN